ncbi:MAG TPA: PspC domain-containing protein [Candidatus Acidoferrales bacterium]|nr:PspC domain-containing protein [Candidatus Acidoferrales bacterium]
MERRLYRSRKNRVIAGVAGGLGEYFDIDPVFIRVIFVVATLAGASGLLAYIILWIVVPKERLMFETNTPTSEGATNMAEGSSGEKQYSNYEYRRHKRNGGVMGGLILIVIGGLFLADNYLPHFSFSDTWPLILVAIGIGLILNSIKRAEERGGSHEGQ